MMKEDYSGLLMDILERAVSEIENIARSELA